LQRARRRCDAGESLQDVVARELKTHRTIPGYGRPLRSVDERLAPAERLARRLGLWEGTFTMLALDIQEILRGKRMGMNVAAIAAGLCADQGLTPREYYRLTLLAFTAGLIHCEFDATIHPEGSLFPLRCDRLHYSGPNPRVW
jgi:hypothetical protein